MTADREIEDGNLNRNAKKRFPTVAKEWSRVVLSLSILCAMKDVLRSTAVRFV